MADSVPNSPKRRGLAQLAVFATVSLAYLLGGLDFVECKLVDLRFEILRRGVSDDLVLVEIDAMSLRTLDGWPWPRSYHAQVTDTLRSAGAERIAFDVDFSARSTRPGDVALAEAFERAEGQIILPVFSQMMRRIGGGERLALTRPLREFGRHATLGSVNVVASNDGLLRRVSTVHGEGIQHFPSFFALLLGENGRGAQSFFIDFGIRPEAITRLSYSDVLLGLFDPELVAGKRVIIGATAMELGDEVAVPIHGSIPGPVLQALAYESLVQDRALKPLPPWLILVATAVITGLAGVGFARWSWRRGLVVLAGGSILLFLIGVTVQAAYPVVVALTPGLAALALVYAVAVMGSVDQLDLKLFAQGIALRRTGAFMHQVVDNSKDGIVTIDAEGRIKSMNRAAEAVLGSPFMHVGGLSFYKLVKGGTWRGLVPESDFYARPQEVRRTRPDGTCSAVQIVISRTEVEDETVYVAILRDVTAERRAAKTAQQAQVRLQEAIERIHEGFALYDPEGNLALSNKQFRALAHLLPGPTDRIDLAALADHAAAFGTPHDEIVLEDGTWLRVSRARTAEGGAVAVYTDITELKHREVQLEVAVREAEAANRSKTEFLANMSHELRTPLNAIIGFSETMVTEMLGPVGTPQYKEYAGDILSSGKHLLDIITDILDVSKIEAGELSTSDSLLEIDTVIEDALRMVRERATSAGIQITTHYPDDMPHLYADRRAVLQVILNLASNALKFSRDGGDIAVTVTSQLGGPLLIAIADNGIGMAEEDVPRALSLFGQVEDSMVRSHEGTGLGLPLSARLMELHDGSLTIDSTLGEGTTVTLEFPAERAIRPVIDLDSARA